MHPAYIAGHPNRLPRLKAWNGAPVKLRALIITCLRIGVQFSTGTRSRETCVLADLRCPRNVSNMSQKSFHVFTGPSWFRKNTTELSWLCEAFKTCMETAWNVQGVGAKKYLIVKGQILLFEKLHLRKRIGYNHFLFQIFCWKVESHCRPDIREEL